MEIWYSTLMSGPYPHWNIANSGWYGRNIFVYLRYRVRRSADAGKMSDTLDAEASQRRHPIQRRAPGLSNATTGGTQHLAPPRHQDRSAKASPGFRLAGTDGARCHMFGWKYGHWSMGNAIDLWGTMAAIWTCVAALCMIYRWWCKVGWKTWRF